MIPECLPFTTIPQTTPLFSAYLYDFPRVQQFYPRPPAAPAWFVDEARGINYDVQRRAAVADILARQNRAFGSSEKTLADIERLRQGACALVTGQQVALFGGPLFSVLKAVTAVRIAAEVSRRGVDCVPVFWLATEDHDHAEVDHVVLPGSDGELRKLVTPLEANEHAPISQARLGGAIEAVVAEAADLLGDTAAMDDLRAAYASGAGMGEAFARLFARWFREAGVILLDASDPALHAVAAPIYSEAARRSRELTSALLDRGRALHDGGFHEQVKVTPSSTLLFALHGGGRTPVHQNNGRFTLGNEKLGEAELLARIQAEPQRFSANVLLRPVVQDYLLPTLAYVGGPSEVAYFAQAAVIYEQLLGRVTPILPRFSATLVEPHIKRLLERYKLEVKDAFAGPEHLRQLLAERTLPADLQQNFDSASAAQEQSMAAISVSLDRLDHTLVDAAKRAGAKMRYQLHRLRTRAANAELRRSDVLARHAGLLSSALYPHDSLQERVLGGAYFLSRYPDLLETLYRAASLRCTGHQVVYL